MLDHPDPNRYVLPMYDRDGEPKGVVVKAYKEGDYRGPKSMTYKEPLYDGMSWYVQSSAPVLEEVFLVEDGLSALALHNKGVSAVSLNGTTLNAERISQINIGTPKVYLCLDADATRTALKHAIKYLGSVNIQVIRLDKDIKDMDDRELEEFLFYKRPEV
jgi:DNA primase